MSFAKSIGMSDFNVVSSSNFSSCKNFAFLTSNSRDNCSNKIMNLVRNFFSISPLMIGQAEQRLYRGRTSFPKKNLTLEYSSACFLSLERLKKQISRRTHSDSVCFSFVRKKIQSFSCWSGDYLIWTIRSLNPPEGATPIVLVHDFGCASGVWIENIDFLSARHPLFIFDILGFGRSSRPNFDTANNVNAEMKFVESIEDWRIAIDLQEKFFLIGHGFGAYLSALYTLRYGQFVKKLILLDPWGFNPKPEENQLHLRTPFWIRAIAYFIRSWTSFSLIRYLGPLGLPILKLLVPRLKRLPPINDVHERSDALYEYFYHVNVQPARFDSNLLFYRLIRMEFVF